MMLLLTPPRISPASLFKHMIHITVCCNPGCAQDVLIHAKVLVYHRRIKPQNFSSIVPSQLAPRLQKHEKQ